MFMNKKDAINVVKRTLGGYFLTILCDKGKKNVMKIYNR